MERLPNFSSIGDFITVGAPLFNIKLNKTVSTLEQPLVGKEFNDSIEIPSNELINEISAATIPTMAVNVLEGKILFQQQFLIISINNIPSQRILFEICQIVTKSLLKFLN